MIVKDVKKIISSATTLVIHIAKTEDDAINEKSCWNPHNTYKGSNEYYYDRLHVVYIYPAGKDELDVWVIADSWMKEY